MEIGILIIYLVLGLVVGSFLNVVILRLKTAESIVVGGSHCPNCKKPIRWYDLIPIVSFVLLRGRCRDCNEKISLQYPLVEATSAVFFALSYLLYGLSWMSALSIIILSLLLVIVVYDLKEMMIPEIFSWILVAVVILGQAVLNYNQIGQVILGGLVGGGVLGLLVLLSKGNWMGDGDIKIGLAIGLFLGFPVAVFSIFSAFVTGAILGGSLLLLKIKKRKDQLPFTPFLVLGLIIAMVWGQQIINWYLGKYII